MSEQPKEFPNNSRVVLLAAYGEELNVGDEGVVRASQTVHNGHQTYIVIDGSGYWVWTSDLRLVSG